MSAFQEYMSVPCVLRSLAASFAWALVSVTPSLFAAASTLARAALAVSCATGWSTTIGVVVMLPSTSIVVVQEKRTGNSSGPVYLTVIAPVSSSFEIVKSTQACSEATIP